MKNTWPKKHQMIGNNQTYAAEIISTAASAVGHTNLLDNKNDDSMNEENMNEI